MKAAAGASRDRKGYGALILIFVIGGLAITGILLLPSLTPKADQRKNAAEEAMLATLADGFQAYVRKLQVIPGTSTWATSIALFTGLNVTQVSCVFPAFPTDDSIQRAFVVDDFLGGSSPLLPYTQSTNGLTGAQTNLLNSRARAMIVSSTKRGLTLPVSTGFIAQTNFDAIWNWAYDPSTKAPPSGWSSTWTGRGDFLHVTTLFLPSLFSTLTLEELKYGVGRSNLVTTTVSSSTNRFFLNGTPLTLATTAGVLKQAHVVCGDTSFNFDATSTSPLIWFQFEEASGASATNSGSLGTTAGGTIASGANYRRNGPRPSAFPNFSSANYAMRFNDVNEYLTTTNSVMNNLTGFTIAGWVYVSQLEDPRTGLFGQNDLAEIGFITTSEVQFWTENACSITVTWPYAYNTWRHIAGTADGTTIRLYFDGVEVGSCTQSVSNYGSSSSTFNVGGGVVFDPPVYNSKLDATFDDVMLFDRALTASEVLALSTGILP